MVFFGGFLAMVGLTMATHHLGLVMRIVGAVVLAGGYALMLRGVAAEDESRGERVGRAIVVTGVVMFLSGGIGTFLADQMDLVPFAVLALGVAVLLAGMWVFTWSETIPAKRPHLATVVSACALSVIAAPVLLTGVVGAFITLTDQYTHRYGTPVTVTPASTCEVWSRNGAVRGNPDCPKSAWRVNGRTVTGVLKINWAIFDGDLPASLPARATGHKAVAIGRTTSKRDKAAVGSLVRTGRIPEKWIVITVAVLCLVPPGWVLVKMSW